MSVLHDIKLLAAPTWYGCTRGASSRSYPTTTIDQQCLETPSGSKRTAGLRPDSLTVLSPYIEVLTMIENHRFIRITWIDRVVLCSVVALPILLPMVIHFCLS